jgi:hypothetical protein
MKVIKGVKSKDKNQRPKIQMKNERWRGVETMD